MNSDQYETFREILKDGTKHLDDCLHRIEAQFKSDLAKLEQRVWGDGETGELPQIKTRLGKLERVIYMAIGMVMLMQFLSGTGTISLSSFLTH